ncbi:Serine/threonine-protein phosphatase 6 regulatory subunit 3-A [Thelohanellus kitauei]|uniref:Serine/threonine-protein phosphatase 6 regulatory subunit 3-A n=1 Tax=Thelohanellus kitauei TaxID=669202 RepID=A0A0C2MEV2_THEKT|nr:Serine/threonine-protein phosphatase 6 regulatory subunit 3-A [Thelohanellus kitauei]
MFWEYSFTVSNLEQLLERDPPPTLDEVLGESDVLQELKSNNQKLINYLVEDENLKLLVQYVTESVQKSKMPYEILISNTSAIDTSVFEDSSNIILLWNCIRTPGDLMLLKRIAGLFDHYIFSKPDEVNQFFVSENINYFQDLISKIHYQPIADLVLRLVSQKNNLGSFLFTVDFLINNCVDELLKHVMSSDGHSARMSASILTELIRSMRNESIAWGDDSNFEEEFMAVLLLDETIVSLINFVVKEQKSTISHYAASLLCVIFNLQRIGSSNGDEFIKPTCVPSGFMKFSKKEFAAIIPLLPDLVNVLTETNSSDGESKSKKFGMLKLYVLETVVSLMLYNDEELAREFSRLNTPNILMDLFEKYPENNIMHSLVELAITSILLGSRWKTPSGVHLCLDNHLINSLFSTDYFVTKLIDLFAKEENFVGHIHQIQRVMYSSLKDSYHQKLMVGAIESFSQEVQNSIKVTEDLLAKVNQKEDIDSRFLRIFDDLDNNDEMIQEPPTSQMTLERAIEFFKSEKARFIYEDMEENFEIKMHLDINTSKVPDPFLEMVPPTIKLDLNQEIFESFRLKAQETISTNIHFTESSSKSDSEILPDQSPNIDQDDENQICKSDSELIDQTNCEKNSSNSNSDYLEVNKNSRYGTSSPVSHYMNQNDIDESPFDDEVKNNQNDPHD